MFAWLKKRLKRRAAHKESAKQRTAAIRARRSVKRRTAPGRGWRRMQGAITPALGARRTGLAAGEALWGYSSGIWENNLYTGEHDTSPRTQRTRLIEQLSF